MVKPLKDTTVMIPKPEAQHHLLRRPLVARLHRRTLEQEPRSTGSSRDTGLDKANQARKRDFASTFREFSQKRLQAEFRWRRDELAEARAGRLADLELRQQEQGDRKAARELQYKQSQSALHKDIREISQPS